MVPTFEKWPVPALWHPALETVRDLLFAPRAYPTAPLSPIQSDAIAAARVFCILGIVYVHAWTGVTWATLMQSSGSAQGIFRWTFVELIGRSSVPLLGMISGWLVASSAIRRGYWNFVGGKAKTVLLPMLLWNALAVTIICGLGWLGWIRAPIPRDLEWVFDEVVGYATFNKLNIQTTFLRDLFICMVLAPVLVRLRTAVLVLLSAVIVAWAIFAWWFPLILRPQIPLFFILGICARRYGGAERVAAMPFAYAALPFAVLGPIKLAVSIWGYRFGLEHTELVATIDVGMRVAAAMLAWRTAIALTSTSLMALMKKIEPYAFFLFCSHMILIWVGGQLIGPLAGRMGTPGYPPFFLIQPLLCLGAAMLIGRFLTEVAPGLASLLSGGRLRGEPRVRPILATA